MIADIRLAPGALGLLLAMLDRSSCDENLPDMPNTLLATSDRPEARRNAEKDSLAPRDPSGLPPSWS